MYELKMRRGRFHYLRMMRQWRFERRIRSLIGESVLLVANDMMAALPHGCHRTVLPRSAGLFQPADRIFRTSRHVVQVTAGAILLAFVMASHAMAEQYQFRSDGVLGSSYELTVMSSSEADAQKAHASALKEISRLENVLSTWKSDSEISRLNTADSLIASQALFDFLSSCEAIRNHTKDAISCRIGNLIGVWKEAQQSGEVPDENELASLAEEISEAPVKFDRASRRIERPDSIIFAVDAMAKGWILDRAADRALNAGEVVNGVILNVGGDIKIAGEVSENAPRIGIAGADAGDNETPMETIIVAKGGIASSGGGKRDMNVGGRQYSHILSPVTGMPQSTIALATVTAPTAAQADALATAFSVMGVGNSLAYANAHEDIEAVIITSGGGRFASEGWGAMLAPVEKLSALEAGVENPWPEDYQMTIEYEVPVIDATNYEAPYVAVWITNPEKELVRSLLMLGDAPRWVEENYRFWRRYGRKHPALIDTLAQPTRRPGHYQLVWDGRNEAGEPVPQGTYLLHVEASREHGGHSYVSSEMNLLDGPAEAIIPAQEEIGEITVHYGLDG